MRKYWFVLGGLGADTSDYIASHKHCEASMNRVLYNNYYNAVRSNTGIGEFHELIFEG